MKFFYLLTFLLVSLLTGCAPSDDGKYIIYKIEPDHKIFVDVSKPGGDDYTIRSFLTTYLKGKKFTLILNDKYALLNSLISSEELLLTRNVEDDYYLGECSKYNATFKFMIKKDENDQILLAIDCNKLESAPIIFPVQLGRKYATREARAVCYLNKIKE